MIISSSQSCKNEIKRIKNSVDAGEKPPERITIFHQLLDPNAAGGHVVPGINDLETEAFAFLGAAADTTGATLTTAAYHAISNEDIYRKLRDELKTAFPDTGAKLDFLTLEKLPYLVLFRFPPTTSYLWLTLTDRRYQRGTKVLQLRLVLSDAVDIRLLG